MRVCVHVSTGCSTVAGCGLGSLVDCVVWRVPGVVVNSIRFWIDANNAGLLLYVYCNQYCKHCAPCSSSELCETFVAQAISRCTCCVPAGAVLKACDHLEHQ
jgi:hypothetical protein